MLRNKSIQAPHVSTVHSTPSRVNMVVANIRITPELAHQLSKESGFASSESPRSSPVPTTSAFSQRHQDSQTKAAVKRSKQLQSALTASESVGDLLLKNETDEATKVQDMASALLASHDCRNERRPPCSHERVAVLDCYKQNSGNELVCASLVSAYQDCSSTKFQSKFQD